MTALIELLRAAVAPVEASATEYSPVKASVAESMLASRVFGESQRRGFESRPEHQPSTQLSWRLSKLGMLGGVCGCDAGKLAGWRACFGFCCGGQGYFGLSG